MNEILTWIDNNIMWGPAMIVFLLGTHIYLTYKTGFVQKRVFKGIVESLRNDPSRKGDLSVFGSLMTALSSTIGTGNIIGVGTAIAIGGPGSVLWTWIGGIFGIATKYAESFIAVKYRRKDEDGAYVGGAMTAFEHLNKPLLGKIFAWCCALGAFGIGCSSQSKAITDIISVNYSVSPIIVALIICALTALVVFGGVKAIARVCEKLVPFMSIVYVLGCLCILVINLPYLPATIATIVSSAFTTRAAVGGFIGTTIIVAARAGIARGLFSNEAGMGSAPQASAASVAVNAVKPALVGSTGVFWDTVVVCLMTGLVLVSSIIGNPEISCILADGSTISGSGLVASCFNQIPFFGKPLLTFGILTFAYSTILGWSYYGENCIRYLFGRKAIRIYQALWIVVIFVGAIVSEGAVWTIADILNAAMCIPNVIAVLMLRNIISKETKYYLYEDHLEESDPELA
ncbi:MAG: alanine:cation symporter family protein [Erysipelotrichaceae bacterium]|nr:alanine:cation symporter family protein [Erysipelotrichaceae bacterium]